MDNGSKCINPITWLHSPNPPKPPCAPAFEGRIEFGVGFAVVDGDPKVQFLEFTRFVASFQDGICFREPEALAVHRQEAGEILVETALGQNPANLLIVGPVRKKMPLRNWK